MEAQIVSTYTIRQASIEDANSLVEFNLRLAKETEDKDLDRSLLQPGVEAILRDANRGFYVVAVNEEEVIGATMVTKEWSDWRNADFWWIQSVYVVKEHRRQGVFRSLFNEVKRLASEQKVCGFRLYVEQQNDVAQKTYHELGWHETIYKMFEMKS